MLGIPTFGCSIFASIHVCTDAVSSRDPRGGTGESTHVLVRKRVAVRTMQQWIVVVAVVIGASESRHYYPYTNYPVFSRAAATTAPPYPQRNINDVTVVDGRTGIVYNPYSKFHPG